MYAISPPYLDVGDMLVDAFPLQEYLDKVPLDLTFVRLKIPRRYFFYALVGGWMLIPPLPQIFRQFASSLGLFRLGRRMYRQLRSARDKLEVTGSIDVALLEDKVQRSVMALNGFDVLVSFEVFEHIWDWPVEQCRAKLICFMHDAIPLRIDEGPSARPDHFFRSAAKAALRADCLVCNSHSTASDIAAFFPTAAGKAVVVPLGHDVWRFERVTPPSSGPSQRCRILMVGSIDHRKNLQGMLRALPHLKQRLPEHELELLIIGNHEQKNFFRSLEQASAPHARIWWSGYVSDQEIINYYADADVFVFPSLWEGFGIPVLEAMTAGVPVVCSDLAALPEVGGEHVIYCDPYEPSAIAEAIAAVVTMDEAERARRVELARQWAAAFTWDAAAEKMAETIRDLVPYLERPDSQEGNIGGKDEESSFEDRVPHPSASASVRTTQRASRPGS